MNALLAALIVLQSSSVVLDNPLMKVVRNDAPCASASAKCGDRVIVALGDIALNGRSMKRGDIQIFKPNESYSKPAGNFVEVSIKPDRPPVKRPPETIAPDKNYSIYEGETFRVFEERLELNDLRPRHSHNQRLVIVLNRTKLHQWPDGQPEFIRDNIPDDIRFSEAVIHKVQNVGDQPHRAIIIEILKP
jgi:hypothetical protein